MASITVATLLAKAPDAQIMGGSVVLHLEGKNVEVGKLVGEDEVILHPAGMFLVESAPAPVEDKPRARKVKVEPEPAAQ